MRLQRPVGDYQTSSLFEGIPVGSDHILISDVGSHKMEIAQSFLTYDPNTGIISNGLASMGIAATGGLAANPATDTNVMVATGDGWFLMNAAEIETTTRLGLGYAIVVFNGDDYGLLSENQIAHSGGRFGSELTNPDFERFAESFGIDGYRPETWVEVKTTIESVVPSTEMSLVEITLG